MRIKTPEASVDIGEYRKFYNQNFTSHHEAEGPHGADIYDQLANHSFSCLHQNGRSEFLNGPVYLSCNISILSPVFRHPRSVLVLLSWSFLPF
jgi:hypothetical protein